MMKRYDNNGMEKIRTRFAPSPTGPQHIGGIRTALYNYLIAKQSGGDFILRIEDTDSSRYVPESEEYILESLKWAGIKPTEGIVIDSSGNWTIDEKYRQSNRKEIYRGFIKKLVDSGHAYYAFDRPEFLDELREMAEKRGDKFSYGPKTRMALRNSLTMTPEEVEKSLKETNSWVIRFKLPDEDQEIEIYDQIRGKIKVHTSTLDDKVLWKRADELPTYHLANVVDDHLMDISDVIRGEEWLPSLPLHVLLYKAFGWDTPRFAHLPLLLKPEGMGHGKLSKRDGNIGGFPVFPISWKSKNINVNGYREAGYFPEAFVNFLAYLGWNPGDNVEIKSMEELIRDFSLYQCQKAGSKFNPAKTRWYNREYLRMKTPLELLDILRPMIVCSGNYNMTNGQALKIIEFLKDRLEFPADIFKQGQVFFQESPGIKIKDWNNFEPYIPRALEFGDYLLHLRDWDNLKEDVERFVSHLPGLWKEGVVLMNTLRMIISGNPKGPDLVQTLQILGSKSLQLRINKFKENYGY